MMRLVVSLVIGGLGGVLGLAIDQWVGRFLQQPAVGVETTETDAGPAVAEESCVVLDPGLRRTITMSATGLLFAGAALRFDLDLALLAYLTLFAALVAISIIDLDRFIVPNRIVYPTGFVMVPLFAAAAATSHDPGDFRSALIGAMAAWGVLLLVHLISPSGMGLGDVRMSFLLGLALGWLGLSHVYVGMLLGTILGAAVGAILVMLKLRTRRDHVPFGPFLAIGTVLAIFIGNPVLRWFGI